MGLQGGPKDTVVHLSDNTTVGCNGQIKSIFVDTRYDILSMSSPITAGLRLIFPSFHEVFPDCSANFSESDCECDKSFIEFVAFVEFVEVKTIVRWWLIAGIIVGGLLLFGILVGIFVCVWRRYNRMLKEEKVDAEKEKQKERSKGDLHEEIKQPAKKPRRYWKKTTSNAAGKQISIHDDDDDDDDKPLMLSFSGGGAGIPLPSRRQTIPVYGLTTTTTTITAKEKVAADRDATVTNDDDDDEEEEGMAAAEGRGELKKEV